MATTHASIERNIKRHKRGELVFPKDFRGKGSDSAIKKTLSRLNKEGTIKRLAHGIYVFPETDPLFGEILPSAETVAESIAKREHVRIKPAGANALHKLGLSTQVPTKLVYLTDGTAREIKLGKNVIRFKATTPKKLSLKGKLSGLIIQALEELGTKNIDPQTEKRLSDLLKKEDFKALQHDLKLATGQIHDYLLKLYNAND